MTPADLAAIQARADKATPGAWDGLNVVRRDRAALLAEIHRLRGLVEAAYDEGGEDGYHDVYDWEHSDAKRLLDGP